VLRGERSVGISGGLPRHQILNTVSGLDFAIKYISGDLIDIIFGCKIPRLRTKNKVTQMEMADGRPFTVL